jgi:thiamine-phosphate pyrophosphorylase
MPRNPLPTGLYVITDSQLIPADRLADSVARAIAGGAVMVQYRDKQHPAAQRARAAAALAELCQRHAVPLIINDDIELAGRVGAAGVHLGAADAAPARARDRLGDAAIIGVSCYNRLENARQAQAAGASYLAFGRFFPSPTKPDAVQARPALLADARRELALPIAAIGGITPENGAELVAAGADLLAVIHGVFGAADVAAAARRYAALFETGPTT